MRKSVEILPPGPRCNFRNRTTLQLGDVKEGSRWWDSEYDVEFSWKNGLPTDEYLPVVRPSLRTPRSFKKGFVHSEEYEALGGRLAVAQSRANELAAQVAGQRAAMAALRGGERTLAHLLENEHASVEALKGQFESLSRSLRGLLQDVDQNRVMIKEVLQDAGSDELLELPEAHPPAKEVPISDRLATLEQQLTDLTRNVQQLLPAQPPKQQEVAVLQPVVAVAEPARAGHRSMSARQRRLVARNTAAVQSHVVRQDKFCQDCYEDLKDAAHSLSVRFLRT